MWTRPHTTNMAINGTARLSYCLASLECPRVTCRFFLINGRFNDCYFHGYLDKKVNSGLLCDDGKTKISCHYCKQVVYCKDPCNSMVYYIMPLSNQFSRLMIHVGHHHHDVHLGTSRARIEKVTKLVVGFLNMDRSPSPCKVQMVVGRQLIVASLIFCGKEDNRAFKESKLTNCFEELMLIVQNQRYHLILMHK